MPSRSSGIQQQEKKLQVQPPKKLLPPQSKGKRKKATQENVIIATGSSHTVRELCQLAFEHVGLDYRDYVEHDVRFERPAEVDHLLGDASKAQENLGWNPSVRFQDLIVMMVESDLKRAAERREA